MSKVVSIRLDDDVKESAKQVAAAMGLSLSAVVNSYLKQVSATRSIFLFAPEALDPATNAKLKAIELEPDSEQFDSVDDLVNSLKD